MKTALLAASAVLLICGSAACATNDANNTAPVARADTAQTERDVDRMNSLTSILIDAGALYRDSAEKVNIAGLRDELLYFAGEREKLADVFQRESASVGGVPAEKGQALGFGHRIFTDMRAAFEDDEKVAAREMLRGEQYLLDELTKTANDQDLSASVRSFSAAYIDAVAKDRDRARDLARKYGADV